MSEFESLIQRLADAGVDFVVVGGLAAVAHGATRLTVDLDVCAPFSEANLARLLEALRDLHARFRSQPPKPLPARAEDLAGFKNLYLETDYGELDVLGEIAGVGTYESVRPRSVELPFLDRTVRVLSLDALIEGKRALGREKDREVLRELELIRLKLASREGDRGAGD